MELEPVRHVLHAVATTVVPEAAALDDRAWAEVEAVIAGALSGRPARMQRQFVVFLRLLQAIPVARYGRPFTALSERQRTTFLRTVERSRVLLVRRGFWGLRTLVFMGYYTREDVAESIGYRGDPGGWAARGGTVATVPLAPTLWVEP
jgi:Gluconate 2-dehydrogenase subunit 3